MSAAAPSSISINFQIISIVFYTLIAFICVSLPIAVIPSYVHEELGFSAAVTGIIIGLQYLATLLSRPMTGRISDNIGTKRVIVLGLAGILVSGVLTFFATLVESLPALSLGILIIGRLLLGVAQGLISVSTVSWCMGAVGAEHTVRSMSWNGIASYGAIAMGAPLGVVMVAEYGYTSLGIALSVLAALGLVLIRNKPSEPVVRGERLSFWAVFGRIAPFGASLCLASISYGTLTTFITLYYLNRGWVGAAYCLTVFGVCFVISRLVFTSAISRLGGFTVAIACMIIETLGMTLLWIAPSTCVALIGAGLAGFGLSLVYPALGVEAIKQVPNSSRGAGLSAYAVFFDLAMAIAGPLMGAVVLNLGYGWIFFCAALLSVTALCLTVLLKRRSC